MNGKVSGHYQGGILNSIAFIFEMKTIQRKEWKEVGNAKGKPVLTTRGKQTQVFQGLEKLAVHVPFFKPTVSFFKPHLKI